MRVQDTVIVLADISGYTRFMNLHGMAIAHAESIITELLNSVIDHTGHPLILNKLEGDAALFYALAEESPQGVVESVLQQVNGIFQTFSTRKQEIGLDGLCTCDACTEVVHLRIKAVVNFGKVLVRRVRKFEELSGTPVIIAHRLLKNAVPLDEYVLLTEDFEQALGRVPSGGTQISEQCEGIGTINATYYPPTPYVTPQPVRNLSRQARMVANAFSHMAKKGLLGFFGIATKRKFRNL
jgi:class 3 adenylate cyclase